MNKFCGFTLWFRYNWHNLEPHHPLVEGGTWSLQEHSFYCAQGFVFNSPCSPHRCVSPSTEIHSRVSRKCRQFLQVERGLLLIKFSLKTKVAFHQFVPCDVFQKELETSVGILDIPKEVRAPRKWIGTFHSQWISFGDSDLIIRLSHWLSSQSTCKLIHTASVRLLDGM